jgi:hypothetical protein
MATSYDQFKPISSSGTVGLNEENQLVYRFGNSTRVTYNPKITPSGAAIARSLPSTQAASQAASSAIKTNEGKFGTPVAKMTVSGEEIRELERKTNLTLYPYIFGGELAKIKHQFSNLNTNKYYLLLSLLVYGFDNQVLQSSVQGQEKYIIDDAFISDFLALARQPELAQILKKTPAWQKGCFDGIGKLGSTEMNANNMSNNPISGPERTTPSLVENLLNRIHPDAVDNLEKFCNTIRTRAYLSLPKGSFGSLGRIVTGLQGVVTAFGKIINDIYNGIIFYIQKIYAWINGIIAEMQRLLMKAIEEIIPIRLICLILDTIQVVLDDINFFTSLFNMSGPFLDYLNTIQNFVNIASNLVSNPFTTVFSYMPPEVQNIINVVNQIGTDPGGYMADQLSNYGYAWVATALRGNLIGALVDKYGPQYGAITPLGNILTKSAAIVSRYGQGATFFPPTAASLGPNLYNGGREDVYGTPVDPGNISLNVENNFRAVGDNLQDVGQGFSDLSKEASEFLGKVGDSLKNVFNED